MKKIRFDDCICQGNILQHQEIRSTLLSLIAETQSNSLVWNNPYYTDSISKLDFDDSEDFNRPWVKKFVEVWEPPLKEMMMGMGYTGMQLFKCWFQQYKQHDTHGWHIHGSHFTGVYYLEFPSKSAKTEVASPYSGKIKKVGVKEGDFIIFPAHWIHRAPPNTSERKTIISWNFDAIQDSINLTLIKGGKPYILF